MFPRVPEAIRRQYGIRSKLAHIGLEYCRGKLYPRTRQQWQEHVRRDTEMCLTWFRKHLGIRPTAYCFPFNEFSQALIDELSEFGFRTFFAGPRSKHANVIPRYDSDGFVSRRSLNRE